MERFEEEEHEPYASITRLVSRLRISRDKATILLILYNWNEQHFDTEFLLSQEYATISSYFVNNPRFNDDLTNCKICNAMELCDNLGCGHYICNTCIQGFIEPTIIQGDLLLQCDFCGKLIYISHFAKKCYVP